MTKCPYVPPHEWELDFPHLMLRYRAAELKQGKSDKVYKQLTETDRNGKAATLRRAGAQLGQRDASRSRAADAEGRRMSTAEASCRNSAAAPW